MREFLLVVIRNDRGENHNKPYFQSKFCPFQATFESAESTLVFMET